MAVATAFPEGVLGRPPMTRGARATSLDVGGSGVLPLFKHGASVEDMPEARAGDAAP